MNARTAAVLMLLALVAQLQSCSRGGAVVLHNATDGLVQLRVGDAGYEIPSRETREVFVDPVFGGGKFSVRTNSGLLCYVMPNVNEKWVKAGFLHAEVLAMIDGAGRIWLYPPDSAEEEFFKSAPPAQPERFPLIGTTC